MDQRLNDIAIAYQLHIHSDITKLDEGFLTQAVLKRLEKNKMKEWSDYIRLIKSDPAEAQALNQELTITTSFFFRDPMTFVALQSILLSLWEKKKNKSEALRIWCAGCAAGQEPYSIAITIQEIQDLLGIKIPFRIFATDLSSAALDIAKAGYYEERILNNVTLRQLKQYFKPLGKGYLITDELRNQVSFSNQDLLNQEGIIPIDSIYGHFDLIFCCNLLIYYKPCVQDDLVKTLLMNLSDHGLLVLGETEYGLLENHPHLNRIQIKTGIFQTKEIIT